MGELQEAEESRTPLMLSQSSRRLRRTFDQRPQNICGDADTASGKPVDVRLIYSHHLTVRIKHRAAARALCCWGVIDQFVPEDVP